MIYGNNTDSGRGAFEVHVWLLSTWYLQAVNVRKMKVSGNYDIEDFGALGILSGTENS